jgi:SAM-dependent methyltransferase
MNSTKTFQERSYERHADHLLEYRAGGKKEKHARTWFDKDTVGAWINQPKYQALNPILSAEPRATWLTIGDGSFGNDARYILENGCDALASDITDVLLKEAEALGYISKYQIENAESLSFEDSKFDYVFCKESYHHFPRPMLALYEMLRVARKGIFLIEPNDAYINRKLTEMAFRKVRDLIIKTLFRIKNVEHGYEEVGNYGYSISRREIQKVALGLNYRVVAFKGINNAYVFGVEYEKLAERGPLQKKVRRLIALKDLLCKLRLMDYNLLVAIIFKQEPSKELRHGLSEEGYEIVVHPENPYLAG